MSAPVPGRWGWEAYGATGGALLFSPPQPAALRTVRMAILEEAHGKWWVVRFGYDVAGFPAPKGAK